MGFLWSKPVKYWVPEDRKLKDLLDEDQQRWKTATDLTGWQIQNSLDNNFADSVLNTVATTEINLSFNGLGDDECEHLARIVKSSKIIKRLILENNHIHAAGAKALAEALNPEKGKEDPCLEMLSLRNNSIGAEGATALSMVMTANKTLKHIDLHYNTIGNKGLEALCNNLRPDFPKDFVLDVRYNGLGGNDPNIDWKELRTKIDQSNIEIEDVDVGPRLIGWPHGD